MGGDKVKVVKPVGSKKYSRSYRWLHWVMAIGICILLLAGQQFNYKLTETYRMAGLQYHSSIGTAIFIAAVIMLVKRFIFRSQRPKPNMPKVKKIMAAGVQFALYFLAVFIPLTGVLTALSSPTPTYIFGLYNIAIWPLNEADFMQFRFIHEIAVLCAIALLFSHAGAALYHHFVVKDDVLLSMVKFGEKMPKVISRFLQKLRLV